MNPRSHHSPSRADLVHELRTIVDEAEQFLKSAADAGDEKFGEVRDRFLKQVSTVRRQLDILEDSALREARHALRNADRAVQANPYTSIGIAAAAGLLIGFLTARR